VTKVLLVLLCLGGVAHADEDPVQLYRRGQEAFAAGRYEEAIDAFSAGYKLDPRPEFLLNLAQCHRALGRREQAIQYLERFLEEAPAAHKLRPAAERTLAELKRSAPPPEPEVEPEPDADREAEPPPRPVGPPRVTADPRPPDPVTAPPTETTRGGSSRLWVWVAAAGAVVAIATTVFLISSRDGGVEVDDTIRLPPP
jgi:hypothetical protein